MSTAIHFGPFRLDLREGRLWNGDTPVQIRAKTFAVLSYLAQRPGELVTKIELLDAVWPDVAVTEDMARICVRELRGALGEDARTARFIETERGRGYRFVIPEDAEPPPPKIGLLGRDEELAALCAHRDQASAGLRRLILISGEAGIGKTALLNAALTEWTQRDPSQPSGLLIGRGQCIEGNGPGEPYLPILEAVADWCRGPRRDAVLAALRSWAPAWLSELPGLPDANFQHARGNGLSRSGDRMLREFCALVEELGQTDTLVLALEDLHWSDSATVDLLSALAQRQQSTRLLVLGTLRPGDASATDHPIARLEHELGRKQLCERLPLELFDEHLVERFLARSFDDPQLGERLAPVVTAQTDGNPFFVRAVSEYLVDYGVIEFGDHGWSLCVEPEAIELRVPDNIRHMVEAELSRLDDATLKMLEVASLIGVEFPAQLLEAVLGDIEEIEAGCDELVRSGQLICAVGEAVWPDGSIGTNYRFRHTFYCSVLQQRVGRTRSRRLHEGLGKRLEIGFANASDEVAGRLAIHFEGCGSDVQAAHWLVRASALAVRRYANREAEQLLLRALELLRAQPESRERLAEELRVQLALGPVVATLRSLAANEVRRIYSRAEELCAVTGDRVGHDPAQLGLQLNDLMRGELSAAVERGRRWLLDAQSGDPKSLVQPKLALGLPLYFLGKLSEARALLESGADAYDPASDRSEAMVYEVDPGADALCYLAWTLWLLGQPDQASQRMDQAEALARDLGHPNSVALVLTCSAWLLLFARDGEAALARSEAAVTFANKHGLQYWLEGARTVHAWALVDSGRAAEGRDQLLEITKSATTLDQHVSQRYGMARMAEAQLKLGDPHAALALMDRLLDGRALGEERVYQSYLLRQRASVLLALPGRDEEAERDLVDAIDTAARQGALGFQLQACIALVRHRSDPATCGRLRTVVEAFDPSLDTGDLREAHALLHDATGV